MTRSRLLALIVKSLSRIRFLVWRFTGEPAGAHAVPISRGGKVILVKLTYAGGWRLPGGAVRRGEDPMKAVERELREEIGMVEHGGVHSEYNLTPATASRPAGGYVFLVRDVDYRPRRTWEIADVREFELERLPDDMSPCARSWIGQVRRLL